MKAVWVRVVAIASLMMVPMATCGAEVKSPEVKEIEQFVKALYTLPISKFEAPVKANGSSDFYKSCEMLGRFLESKLITREKSRSCTLATRSLVEVYFRYPSTGQDDTGDIYKAKKPFKYKIESIKAEGNSGVAKVFIPQNDWGLDGRIVYFLSKTEKGWRIANLLAYRQWPLDLKGERADCRDQSSHYYFAQPRPRRPCLTTCRRLAARWNLKNGGALARPDGEHGPRVSETS